MKESRDDYKILDSIGHINRSKQTSRGMHSKMTNQSGLERADDLPKSD